MRSTHGGNDAQVDEGLSLLASTSEQGGQRLSLSRRSVILREAGLARLKSRAPLTLQVARPTGIWLWLEAPSRIPAFATLMAAVLIVGFAYMRTSLPVQDLPTREPLPTGPSDVRVSQNGDEIVLQWSDAKKDAYLVRQASSARQVYTSPGVEVRGTQYVDRSSSISAVVYYLVE